jgi:non-lysosomal glucosylceramidase
MPEPSSSNPLHAAGPQRVFSGAALTEVAFPLGGIGTGTVSLGGRGQLRDWEIFNRPGKGKVLPYTFFALWARPEGGEPVARVLERRLLPSYARGSGLPTATVSGLPRLKEARFRGEYPFAWIEFEDEALPAWRLSTRSSLAMPMPPVSRSRCSAGRSPTGARLPWMRAWRSAS